MSALDQEQDVVDLAEKLGLTGSPVAAIINFCQDQIDTWVQESGGVTSVDELEAVVADRLNLVFEEVNEESDFDRLKAKYVPMGEPIFAALKLDLTDVLSKHKDGQKILAVLGGKLSTDLAGTLWSPKLDLGATFDNALKSALKNTVEDATKGAIDDLLKGKKPDLGDLFKKLGGKK